jgi:trk system potassium uptake protein TrkH
MNFKPILLINGMLLSIIAITMLIPAIIDFLADNHEWVSFFISAFLTAFVSICLVLTNQGEIENINIKQALALAVSTMLTMAAFAALPFWLSELNLSYTDAIFESMSGLTTTGSTILVGLDYMPQGILMWRSILQVIGGMYTIVISLTIFPMLQIGGMQIFRTESSEASEKILPRVAQISIAIASVYLLLIVICATALFGLGMSGFDAINHAMTTISTGGFSTHDLSILYFNNQYIEYTIAFFMLLSSLPFVLYIRMLRGDTSSILNDSQVHGFALITAFCIISVVLWLVIVDGFNIESAFRFSTFNIISVISTTGFSSSNYSAWGALTTALFFQLSVIGGCAGSTSGGIKIFRYQVLYHTAKTQISNMIRPHAIFRTRFNGQAISETVVTSVMNYFILFAFCFMCMAIGLSLFGLDYVSSISAAASALANLGPSLGESGGPMGNYSTIATPAKWLLTFGMLIGRLEIFTVLLLFSKYFWRN